MLEGLRRHPEMMERVQSILEIASNESGPLKSADEVEALGIEEMRRLGHSTMSQWATVMANWWNAEPHRNRSEGSPFSSKSTPSAPDRALPFPSDSR